VGSGIFIEGGEPAQAPTPPPADHPWDLVKIRKLAEEVGLVLLDPPEPAP
jgi:hypothetical protein